MLSFLSIFDLLDIVLLYKNHKYLEQTHVEEELKDGVNWNVEVDVHGHTSGPHVLAFLEGIDFLAANYSEDEE